MTVKAKFKIASVTTSAGWTAENPFVYNVTAYPVTGGSDENKGFYASTPSGKLEMGGLSESVASNLVPGKDYYLTIEAAE